MFARVVVKDTPEYRVAALGVHLVGDLVGNSHKQITEPGIASRKRKGPIKACLVTNHSSRSKDGQHLGCLFKDVHQLLRGSLSPELGRNRQTGDVAVPVLLVALDLGHDLKENRHPFSQDSTSRPAKLVSLTVAFEALGY